MTNFKKNQKLRFSKTDESIVKQQVEFDTEDEGGWVLITHSGNEFSMSLENWNKLKEMVDSVVNQNSENQTTSKTVTVIDVWERSKEHLTLGKNYEVIKIHRNGRRFFILDDKGKKRNYDFNCLQFKINFDY